MPKHSENPCSGGTYSASHYALHPKHHYWMAKALDAGCFSVCSVTRGEGEGAVVQAPMHPVASIGPHEISGSRDWLPLWFYWARPAQYSDCHLSSHRTLGLFLFPPHHHNTGHYTLKGAPQNNTKSQKPQRIIFLTHLIIISLAARLMTHRTISKMELSIWRSWAEIR